MSPGMQLWWALTVGTEETQRAVTTALTDHFNPRLKSPTKSAPLQNDSSYANIASMQTDESPRPRPNPARNRFCGPWALALAGCYPDADAAARALRICSGRPCIHGVSVELLHEVIYAAGFTPKEAGRWAMWPIRARPTVRTFREQNPVGTFVVRVRGHYVVVCHGQSADNQHPWWRDGWKDFDKLRLLDAWQIEKST